MVADDQRQHNSKQERFTARVVVPWTNSYGEKTELFLLKKLLCWQGCTKITFRTK